MLLDSTRIPAVPILASPDPRRAVAPPDLVWRLEVRQYHEMIEAGILGENDPVELLDGLLVPKMAKNPPHSLANGLIHEAITRLLPNGWFADSQEPITTADSEPEPDLRVVRGERRQYRGRHPGPQDVGLVVEVSDASLERDRTLKQQLYARAGIPVYWIVDLRGYGLEVYSEPSGPEDAAGAAGYRRRERLGAGDQVVLVLDGVEVGELAVDELMP
jgi:Uma2 family endonuclease